MYSSKKDFLIGLCIQPTRIVSIVILLPLFLPFDFTWQTAQWFFYGFGILFPSSFFVESLLRLRKEVFQNNLSIKYELVNIFKRLYPKYEQNVSLEFVSIAAFTIFSFSSDRDLVFWWSIKILIITTVWQIFTEFHHAKLIPKLNQIKMSEQAKMVSFVFIIIFLVFFWIWVYVFVENKFQFS